MTERDLDNEILESIREIKAYRYFFGVLLCRLKLFHLP